MSRNEWRRSFRPGQRRSSAGSNATSSHDASGTFPSTTSTSTSSLLAPLTRGKPPDDSAPHPPPSALPPPPLFLCRVDTEFDCSRWLPYSLWTVILSMLPRKDLLSVLAVNRTLNMVGSHVLVLQELEVNVNMEANCSTEAETPISLVVPLATSHCIATWEELSSERDVNAAPAPTSSTSSNSSTGVPTQTPSSASSTTQTNSNGSTRPGRLAALPQLIRAASQGLRQRKLSYVPEYDASPASTGATRSTRNSAATTSLIDIPEPVVDVVEELPSSFPLFGAPSSDEQSPAARRAWGSSSTARSASLASDDRSPSPKGASPSWVSSPTTTPIGAGSAVSSAGRGRGSSGGTTNTPLKRTSNAGANDAKVPLARTKDSPFFASSPSFFLNSDGASTHHRATTNAPSSLSPSKAATNSSTTPSPSPATTTTIDTFLDPFELKPPTSFNVPQDASGIRPSSAVQVRPRLHTRIEEQHTTVVELDLGSMNMWVLRPITVRTISKIANLRELSLSRNHLSSLPARIKDLRHLVTLNLSHNAFVTFPTELMYPSSSLELLDLSHNELALVPPKIAVLRHLKLLNLSHNRLSGLPHTFGELHDLRLLYLNNNDFATFPECVTRLQSLLRLSLSHNRLASLPESISALTRLSHLDVRNNELVIFPPIAYSSAATATVPRPDSVPGTIASAMNGTDSSASSADATTSTSTSTAVDVPSSSSPSSNSSTLSTSPTSMSASSLAAAASVITPLSLPTVPGIAAAAAAAVAPPTVLMVALSNNKLVNVAPQRKRFLMHLTSLDLSSRHISHIPDEFCLLTLLRHLKLANNPLLRLPFDFKRLESLMSLDLEGCLFESIPLSLAYLPLLATLTMASNCMKVLRIAPAPGEGAAAAAANDSSSSPSSSLGDDSSSNTTLFPNLQRLSLARNQLSDVLLDLVNSFPVLAELDLSHNKFVRLPPTPAGSVCATPPSLRRLDLSYNALVSVAELGAPPELRSLNLQHNKLSSLPYSLVACTFLQEIDLHNNPLDFMPIELSSVSTAQPLLSYLRELRNECTEPRRVRLFVLGEEKTGKSHLIQALNEGHSSSDGVYSSTSASGKRSAAATKYHKFAGRSIFKTDSNIDSKISIRYWDDGASASATTTTAADLDAESATTATTTTTPSSTVPSSTPATSTTTLAASTTAPSNIPTTIATALLVAGAPPTSITEAASSTAPVGGSTHPPLSSSLSSPALSIPREFTASTTASPPSSPSLSTPGSGAIHSSVFEFSGSHRDIRLSHQFFLANHSVHMITFNLSKPSQIKEITFWLSSVQQYSPRSHVFLVGTHHDLKKCTDEYLQTQNSMIERLYTSWTTLIQKNAHVVTLHRCEDYVAADGSRRPLVFWPVSGTRGSGISQLKRKYLQVARSINPASSQYVPRLYTEFAKLIIHKRRELSVPIVSWNKLITWGRMLGIDEACLPEVAHVLTDWGIVVFVASATGEMGEVGHALTRQLIIDPHCVPLLLSQVSSTKRIKAKNGIILQSILEMNWSAIGCSSRQQEYITDLLVSRMVLLELPEHRMHEGRAYMRFSIRSPAFEGGVGGAGLSASGPPSSYGTPATSSHQFARSVGFNSGNDSNNNNNDASGSSVATTGSGALSFFSEFQKVSRRSLRFKSNNDHSQLSSSLAAPASTTPAVSFLPVDSAGSLLSDQPKRQTTKQYLVPRLLSSARPAELMHSTYRAGMVSRWYFFPFLPEGLYDRFVIRCLQFAIPEVNWKRGILLRSDEEFLLAESLDQPDGSSIARALIRLTAFTGSGQAPTTMFRWAVQALEGLFSDWYAKLRDRVVVRGSCIACIRSERAEQHTFDLATCIEEYMEDDSCECFMCPECGGANDVLWIVPELRHPFAGTAEDCMIDESKAGFEAGAKLGEGSYGVVKRVKLKMLGRVATYVAIKQLRYFMVSLMTLVEFQNEVAVLRELAHPNIIRLYYAYARPPSIITGFYPLGSIDRLLYSKPRLAAFTWEFQVRCAIDVAQGLEFMHSRAIPILHRDLKSANVLVQDLEPTSAVVAALCDFGLATRFTGTESRGPNDNPRWTAPEVLQYQPYTTKADIYSYGVVLFEIMTGRVPFDDDSFEFIVSKRVIKGDRPRLPDSIEPRMAALISRCWSQLPAQRPEWSAILHELRSILVSTTSITIERPGTLSQSFSRRAGTAVIEWTAAQPANASATLSAAAPRAGCKPALATTTTTTTATSNSSNSSSIVDVHTSR